jgi:hypothetical protein
LGSHKTRIRTCLFGLRVVYNTFYNMWTRFSYHKKVLENVFLKVM